MSIETIFAWQVLFHCLVWHTVGFVPQITSSQVRANSVASEWDCYVARASQGNTRKAMRACYGGNNGQSELEKARGAIYRQSVLCREELSAIQGDLHAAISQLHQEASSIAQYRLGASLAKNSDTVRILNDGSLCNLVRRVTGDDTMVLASHLPVQVRSYEKFGANMAWHEDDVLYDPPQVEAVLTLENTSDCVTMWKEGEQVVHSKETDPNSVLLLQAGGPLHCVTSLKRGRRIIIKCAYVSSTATFRDGTYKDQFRTAAKKGRKSKNRKR